MSVQRARGEWSPQPVGPDADELLSLHAGQSLYILVRGDWRDTTVLAIIGPEALLEYVLPSGRSALRRVPKNYRRGHGPGWPYKNLSYWTMPKYWLLAVARNDLNWWASPQQVPDLWMTPREFFLSRWPEEEYRLHLPMEGPTPAQMQAQTRTTNRVRARL